MSKIYVGLLLIFFSGVSFSQSQPTLNNAAKEYFTQEQINSMSQTYVEAMNYVVKYSWDIHRRFDKRNDTIVNFNRDTVDIRPFLKARNADNRVWINDVYPGLVVVLHSKAEIRERLKDIYNKQ